LTLTPNPDTMDTMNDLDITLDTFRSEVLGCTSYAFTDEQLEEFYEDGYTVQDTLDWAEWRLARSAYEELGF